MRIPRAGQFPGRRSVTLRTADRTLDFDQEHGTRAAVDMFPHTPHVETVALLERSGE